MTPSWQWKQRALSGGGVVETNHGFPFCTYLLQITPTDQSQSFITLVNSWFFSGFARKKIHELTTTERWPGCFWEGFFKLIRPYFLVWSKEDYLSAELSFPGWRPFIVERLAGNCSQCCWQISAVMRNLNGTEVTMVQSATQSVSTPDVIRETKSQIVTFPDSPNAQVFSFRIMAGCNGTDCKIREAEGSRRSH